MMPRRRAKYVSKPGAILPPNAKLRVCLKCQEEFVSFGNRICDDCTIDNNNHGKRIGSLGRQTRKGYGQTSSFK